MAAGAAGFLVVGALQAAGAIPTIYRDSLVVISGMLAAFLMTLVLSIAYYHRRWGLGLLGAVLSLLLPYFVNTLWARFSIRSLLYPTVAVALFGLLTLMAIHRRISGPQSEDDTEAELIKQFIEDVDSNLTWKDRVIWICFACGLALLLVLLLR
jgi:hypothetical protein